MTKFSDQLFDDLMREHGATLASTRTPPTPKRHLAARPVLLTAGAGGLAVAATVGTLVAGGAAPAYAVTRHPDGTVTLALYQKSGIPGANATLHQVGAGRVVVVPVGPGCPGISSLPGPELPGGHVSHQSGVAAQGGKVTTQGGHGVTDGGKVTSQGGKPAVPVPGKAPISVVKEKDGSISVNTLSVPPGDILVLAYATTANGMSEGAARLTTGPVPSCVSLPAPPVESGHGNVARTGDSTRAKTSAATKQNSSGCLSIAKVPASSVSSLRAEAKASGPTGATATSTKTPIEVTKGCSPTGTPGAGGSTGRGSEGTGSSD